MADERVKMECPTCGYKSFPQWLNDKAHCLKCQAILKRRPGVHGAGKKAFETSQNGTRHTPTATADGESLARRAPGEVSTYKESPSSAMESTSGMCDKSPNGTHYWKFGKCAYCQKPEGRSAQAPKTSEAASDRERMECPKCGYKSVPQWLNDEAHCLKCQAVLKTRPGVHGGKGAGKGYFGATTGQVVAVGPTSAVDGEMLDRRQPGEVSTLKYAPGSAMESVSGDCPKSNDGKHHWKFGKCSYCQKTEGVLAKGAGAMANPGGYGGECSRGGKCMFKFAKCQKCGRAEF